MGRRFPAPVLRAVVLVAALAVQQPRPALAAFETSWPTAREAALLGVWPDSGPGPGGGPGAPGTSPRPLSVGRVCVSAGRLYGLAEAVGWSAGAELSVLGRAARIEMSAVGTDLYRERTGEVRVACIPGGRAGPAVAVRVLGLGAAGLDDLWTLAVDAEVSAVLAGRLVVGARCENLTAARIGGSPVASRARVGAALVLSGASLHVSALLEEGFDVRRTLACETRISDWLRARAAAEVGPGRFSAGLGFGREEGGRWPVLDLAWQWHPELGGSTFVSISFDLRGSGGGAGASRAGGSGGQSTVGVGGRFGG